MEEQSGRWGTREQRGEIVFQNEAIALRKLWVWRGVEIKCDTYREPDALVVRSLDGGACPCRLAGFDGAFLQEDSYDEIGGLYGGMRRVKRDGLYGFVDKAGRLAVPLRYTQAKDFNYDGRAFVQRDGRQFVMDKTGCEKPLPGHGPGRQYGQVGEFSDGMCRVDISTPDTPLSWKTDGFREYDDPGIWGYINEAGEEVIAPQFVFADDFEDGVAIVAKGKWTMEADRQGQTYPVWAPTLWGAIDKTGREVIPFRFDELIRSPGEPSVVYAHIGGWRDGDWGIVDLAGNWLMEPGYYENFDFVAWCENGLAEICLNEYLGREEASAIYDLAQKKDLLGQRFRDVEFLENGDILVTDYDEANDRESIRIIDRQGHTLLQFPADYLSDYDTWPAADSYQVMVREGDIRRRGVIDRAGRELLPLREDVETVFLQHRRYSFVKDGKAGLRDYGGRELLPPVYNAVGDGSDKERPLLKVVGDGQNTTGLFSYDGAQALPCRYESIQWCGDEFLLCRNGEGYELYRLEPPPEKPAAPEKRGLRSALDRLLKR